MRKLFTFLVAFLATLSGAVWGQEMPQTTDWNMSQNGQLDITSTEKHYRVTGDAPNSNESHILVNLPNSTDEVHLTLAGASVNQNNDGNRSALSIQKGTVYLHLEDGTVNSMVSGHNRAGIYVSTDATLIIDGEGSLRAECAKTAGTKNALAAGIGGGGGGNYSPNFGTIWIKGGNITARSYSDGAEGEVIGAHAYGAGIGGGQGSSEGTIIITGGTVNASCEDLDGLATPGYFEAYGAGIGGGYNGTCTSITILGGDVTAKNISHKKSAAGSTIGVGYGQGVSSPSIILGKWDKGSDSPEIKEINNSGWKAADNGNYLDARNGTEYEGKGTVTLPAKTQMYLTAAPTQATLNAHTMKLVKTKDQMEGAHTITVYTKDGGKTPDQIIEQFANLYYGADCTVEVPSNIHCDKGHHFMGWMKAVGTAPAAAIQEPVDGTGTVSGPKGDEGEKLLKYTTVGDASSIEKTTYSAVWVDNEMPITVKTSTNWTTNTNVAPKVSVTPAEAVSLLEYTFNDGSHCCPKKIS